MPLIWGTSRQIPSFLETLNPAPGWGSLIRRQIGRSCRNWPKTTSGRGDGRWAGVYSRCGDNWGDWGGHCGLWWTIAVWIVVDTVVDSVVDTVDCGGHTLDTFAWIGGAAGKCGEEDWEFSLWGIFRTMLQRFMLRGPTKRKNSYISPIWIEIFGTMNQIAERNFQTRKQKYPRIAASWFSQHL